MTAHIMFGYTKSRHAWCGVDVSRQTWAYADVTHALLALRETTVIAPCPACLQHVRQVIDAELMTTPCTDSRAMEPPPCPASEYQRRHAIAAQEDEMEHAAANHAVYNSILAKLKTRQRACFAPTEVFEVLYVDGEPHRVYLDAHGTMRFCGNPVVRRILDASAYTLNDVARGAHSRRDVQRLYIEIGYSVDGFLGLSMNDVIHLSLTPPDPAP